MTRSGISSARARGLHLAGEAWAPRPPRRRSEFGPRDPCPGRRRSGGSRCLALYGISIRGRVIEIHGATEPEAMEAEIRAALKAKATIGGYAR